MSRLIDTIDYNTKVKIGNKWYIAKPVGEDSLEFRVKSLELFSLRCDLELYNLETAFGGRRESQFECFLIL